jgi:hypothetical protein
MTRKYAVEVVSITLCEKKLKYTSNATSNLRIEIIF